VRDANRNQLWARAVTEELVRAGVERVCVAPGSRSTPLVLEAASREGLDLLTHLDERSAGFFALGIGRATGRPAAVITTSGTAAANLLPPVVEASQSEVPLLLLTADRPPHLRDSDANQAIDQIRLYGTFVRRFVDVAPPSVDGRALRHVRSQTVRAVADALGPPAGPVHMNFPFRKPLEPTPVEGDVAPAFLEEHPRAGLGRADGAPFVRVRAGRARPEPTEIEAVASVVSEAERGLVVAGPSAEPHRTGPAAIALSAAAGIPVLADPLSGARYAPAGEAVVCGRYDHYLGDPAVVEALRPDVVVRVGASPTSSRLCGALEAWTDARQVVVDAGHRWKDHLAVATDYLRADPTEALSAVAAAASGTTASGWRDRWARAEAAAAEAVDRELHGPFFEGAVMRSVSDELPEGQALFVSNSMPVRDLDAFVPPEDRPLEIYGNRGASGIDGIVSTALGVSAGLGRPVVAVLGDLAFFHDMNGLLAARERDAEVVFVVIHNDGGGIFHMLPIREHEPEFTRFFATPHGLDFRHAAELHGLPHERVEGAGALGAAIRRALDEGGSRVVEVRTDREENRKRHEEVAAAVRDTVRRALETVNDEE